MKRLQRIRSSSHLRDLTSETSFGMAQLIQPLFAVEGIPKSEEIAGLRGTLRQPLGDIIKQVEKDLEAGVSHFILFPVPSKKSLQNFDHQFTAKVIGEIKKKFG